ncbi:hypothetical protein ACFP2F_02685 [Hymenobacter artigasi]|uniref:Uncharacterized protein n=1 Tax=Hymenobacter artigasi TaxID=2719616 RepID=A0ABX1HD98_9BACT|nr:hypothetical protein [Hymenobacter artigasi]NKI87960.1 hypothetical protein [Hymenobacter artigasi]
MRPELERLQLIEQQLLNNPAALPAQDWNVRLLIDGELAADAQAQQQLYHGLRVAGRRQLRQELRLIHERLHAGRFAWLRRLWPG